MFQKHFDMVVSIISKRKKSYTIVIMKIQHECVPCLFKRIIYESNLSNSDTTKKSNAIKAAAASMSKTYDPATCSATIATSMHRAAYKALDDPDPYRLLKDRSNTIAKNLLPIVETLIKQSEDPLYTSILCAIVGNMLDFGIDGASSHPEKLLETFEDAVSEGLGYDDYPKVKRLLRKAHHVMFFTDNCGEIVFDKILCREMKYVFPNVRITLVVKGEPVLSDATIKDAMDVGFDTVADEVFTTGCFAVGVDFFRLPPKVSERLKAADIICCKGMANYESFSETSYRPIVYLLRTKCKPIAQSMGIPFNINAIKLYQ